MKNRSQTSSRFRRNWIVEITNNSATSDEYYDNDESEHACVSRSHRISDSLALVDSSSHSFVVTQRNEHQQHKYYYYYYYYYNNE